MTLDITLEQTYPFPPERVWRALTDRAALSEWLMPCDFEPRLGHRFQFRSKAIPGWRGFVDCEVIEFVPQQRLAYTWLGDDDWPEPAIVRWILEPVEGGTRLRLEHTNLHESGPHLRNLFTQGWKKMLEAKLLHVLEHMGRHP